MQLTLNTAVPQYQCLSGSATAHLVHSAQLAAWCSQESQQSHNVPFSTQSAPELTVTTLKMLCHHAAITHECRQSYALQGCSISHTGVYTARGLHASTLQSHNGYLPYGFTYTYQHKPQLQAEHAWHPTTATAMSCQRHPYSMYPWMPYSFLRHILMSATAERPP